MNIFFSVFGRIYFFQTVMDGYAHFICSPDVTPQIELDILCGDPEDKV